MRESKAAPSPIPDASLESFRANAFVKVELSIPTSIRMGGNRGLFFFLSSVSCLSHLAQRSHDDTWRRGKVE